MNELCQYYRYTPYSAINESTFLMAAETVKNISGEYKVKTYLYPKSHITNILQYHPSVLGLVCNDVGGSNKVTVHKLMELEAMHATIPT